MIPQFFVFVDSDPTPEQLGLVKGLLDYKFFPFVDGVNGDNLDWFKKNLQTCEYRLYCFRDGKTNAYKDREMYKPDLLVAYSEGVEVCEYDWELMLKIVQKNYCLNTEKIDEDVLKLALDHFERPVTVEKKQEKKIESEVVLPVAFGFRAAKIDKVSFYEIVKPNVLEPYVTLVEDIETYPMDMYTNWFKSQSFGVYEGDIAFLHKIWEHHGGKGVLNLEKEYEKRVKRCEGGEKEPLVWRSSLEKVMDIYKNARDCSQVGGKRKPSSVEMRRKK